MLKFAANLSLLWAELPYLDRFGAAAQAGFGAVEVLFPYDLAAAQTRRALIANGLDLILINGPPPNYAGGAPGFAALPGGEARFQHDMKRVFRYVDVLKPKFLHVMAGEADGAEARETMIRNLAWAAAAAPEGLILTIEPLNPVAMPGYFLNDYDLAAEILGVVDAPNVALQYDSYHAQMIHGDAVAVLETHKRRVAHVQIGDTPDRGPPGSGEVDFDRLFSILAASGYKGWISAEYTPGRRTEETLDWFTRL